MAQPYKITGVLFQEAEYVQLIDTNNVVVERYVDDNNTLSAELDNKRLEVAMLTEVSSNFANTYCVVEILTCI